MNDATGNYAYTYNARGQVTGVKFNEADYLTYTYDKAGNVVSYSNLFLNETIGYEYDKNNRVVKMGEEEYVYDKNGNIVEVNNGAGLWVTYKYDKNNRVTEVVNQPLNLFSVTNTTYPTFTYKYEYYANGYEKSKTDFNGTMNYVYDEAGRISLVTDSKTGATRQYTYDLNGNRTGLSETFTADKMGSATFMGSSVAYNSKTTNYTYSNTNELVSAQESYSVTGGTVEKITHYEYDNVGNEVSNRVNYATSGEISFGVIDKNDWGVIDYCVEYTTNEYDALNRLVYVNSVKNSNQDEETYTYNGDGLRLSSTVKGFSNSYQNETRFYHYNGSKLMNITRNALNSETGKISYIPSLTGYTGFEENGQTLIYTKNAHGDVNATVNATGNVVDLYTYDEFGNVDYLQKTTDNRILYAGEYLDTETGNYYLKARYYNPYTGRFTQRDPHWTPENMIYGDVSESTPAPDVRSSDYAVYVPTPIQRNATVLPTDKNKDDKVQSIIAETMAFSQSATYNGNLYESYFASFGTTEEGLFAAIIARQADNGAILQSTNLYVYCTNNPVMYVDPWGLTEQGVEETEETTLEDIFTITKKGTDPIKITVKENTVNIIAYVSISGSGADKVCPGTNKTYRQLYVEGIQESWTTTQEFLTDEDKTYTVNVIVVDLNVGTTKYLYRNQESINVSIVNRAGTSNVKWGLFKPWSKSNPGKATIYTSNKDETVRSAQEFKYTCAHEFGHNLGIGDAYLNPITTPLNDMMKWNNGVDPVVSKYDTWKVLSAFSKNKYKNF